MNKTDYLFEQLNNIGFIVTNKEDKNAVNFIALPNINRIRWLIPMSKNIDRANSILIYQESTLKGFLLKNAICRIPIILIQLFMSKNYIYINYMNNSIINQVNIEYPQYAIFCGTPGKHCKITIQISRNNKPVYYTKVTNNSEINLLFINELNILNHLNNIQTVNDHFPNCVLYNEINKYWFFGSSTNKDRNSKIVKELNSKHVDFLVKLYNSGSSEVISRKCRFYNLLHNSFQLINPKESWILNIFDKAIDEISKYNVKASIAHRDFTVWNTYFNKNNIFVFDWEYSMCDYPPFYDILHFIIQINVLRKMDIKKTINKVYKNKYIKEYAEKINVRYNLLPYFMVLYIVDIQLLYDMKSDNHKTDINTRNNRISLLRYLGGILC